MRGVAEGRGSVRRPPRARVSAGPAPLARLAGTAMAASLTLLASLVSPTPAAAQDLEVIAQRAGIPLPEGYWTRKAEDPLAFELPNGFFGRREALPPVRAPGLVPQRAGAPFLGTARFPVVLALFADSPEPWVTPEMVEQSVFTGPSDPGTLTQFYEAASYGQFSVDGDVLPWVRTSLPLAQVVGSDDGLGQDARTGEYLMEALDLLDDQVDFRQYDNDGPDGIPDSGDDDGVVDLVTFEFLEVAASCGGPSIWPHRWGISGWNDDQPWVSDDVGAGGSPVVVDGYIMQGTTDCSGLQVQGSATITHEFGHALGLPDYYHAVGGRTPDFRRWVLGCWDIMAAGAWGCGPITSGRPGFGPTGMSAWNRHVLGWLDFREVGAVRDTVVELSSLRLSPDALRVPLGSAPEAASLILEYRDREGFDADLPGSGVLVVRVDPGGELRPESGYRYFLSLLEADGDSALVKTFSQGGDRGVPGDAFGVPGGASRLHALTVPDTRTPVGGSTSVTFHEIVETATGARIRLSTHPVPEVVAPSSLTFRAGTHPQASLLVAGGTLPLTPRSLGALPDGVELVADGELIRITGVALQDGAFTLELEVRDALGEVTTLSLPFTVEPFQLEVARLAEALLGGSPLTTPEEAYLDGRGNGNGSLDVGDARAWRYPPGG